MSQSTFTSEDIFIIIMTLLGFLGGALLYVFKLPAIIIATFLGMGISSLVYRFLGGLNQTAFQIGTLKLSGSIAALIGSIWFLNMQLADQINISEVHHIPALRFEANPHHIKAISTVKPHAILGTVAPSEISELSLFNDLSNTVHHFVVTDRLPPESEPVNLDPLPFSIKPQKYGGEYSRYDILDKDNKILHNGSIYRRQAETFRVKDYFYVISVVEVNHNPAPSANAYAKFAIGELRPGLDFSLFESNIKNNIANTQ